MGYIRNGETTLGDDIERIRLIRNKVYGHISCLCISETEFQENWSIITDICNRMHTLLGKNYVQSLQNAEVRTIDTEMESRYVEKFRDFYEAEKSTRELLEKIHVMAEKAFTSQETVKIEATNPRKRKIAETFTDTSIFILNTMVDSINERTSDSQIEELYETIEEYIVEDEEECIRLAFDPFFEELRQKIAMYANLQEKNTMKILKRFFQFNRKMKKKYNAVINSSKGSLLLKFTFSSKQSYDLYRQDLEKGEIGRQILELLLYPPYLECFDLLVDDLIIYLNNEVITETADHQLGTSDDSPCYNCDETSKFYCKSCGKGMCLNCAVLHHENEMTHELYPYKHNPPQECKVHPTHVLDYLCKECHIPVCSACLKSSDHPGHTFDAFKKIYANLFEHYHKKILSIRNEYFLPAGKALNDIKENAKKIKTIFDDLRTDMKSEAEDLKRLIDTVVTENMAQLSKIEKELLQVLENQNKTINDYIFYLNSVVKSCESNLPDFEESDTVSIPDLKEIKVKPMPEAPEPEFPVYNARHFKKSDIKKLLGKLYNTGKVSKKREIRLPGIKKAFHISLDKSGGFWVSDCNGTLVLTYQLLGKQIQTMEIKCHGTRGFHSVTKNGNLMFIDRNKKVIHKVTQNSKIRKFTETGDWRPTCIYCSHVNGDILVGLKMQNESKVTRYNKKGLRIRNIQWDNLEALYKYPHYITENINEDICTSDYKKEAVVVVDKFGRHRFSYRGRPGKPMCPYGICTNVLGHILVCDAISRTVHRMDKDGNFLSLLVTPKHGISLPSSLCVDDQSNLYVGQRDSDIIMVYKYIDQQINL